MLLPCCIVQLADRSFLVFLADLHLEKRPHMVYSRGLVPPHLRLECFDPHSMRIDSPYSRLYSHTCESLDSASTSGPAYS